MTKETNNLSTRILEILPGALTWLVIISPVLLSFRLPLFVAGFILFLDLYWFYKGYRIAFFSWIGYRKMRQAIATDWLSKLQKANFKTGNWNWENFYQLLVIPTYKEPIYILQSTLAAIDKSSYPHEKIMVLVCFEEKEGEEKLKVKRQKLKVEFEEKFKKLFFTVHPRDYPGHHPGPGSNRTYGVKTILPKLKKMGIKPHQVILTTLDADFVIHEKFLSGLTYKYFTTPRPEHKTFTGIFWYYNNFWQAPAPSRVIASGVSFWQLSEMTGSDKYMNFSSHSINLQSLIDMDYWVVDKVNDDGEFYWRAFFHFAGDYQVVPHFLPIFADTVQYKNVWLSLREQYLQLQRWAYGVEHIPYIIKNYFHRIDIPWWPKTDRVIFLLRSYLTWSTLAVLVTFGGLVLQFLNPIFARTVLAHNLPRFSSGILTAALIGLLFLIFIHEKIVPPRPKEWGWSKKIMSVLQWVLVPIVVLSFGTLPAIDAQTRLMLGKYMEFRVTHKYRQVRDN